MGNFQLETTSISSTVTESFIYSWSKRKGIFNFPSVFSISLPPVCSWGQSPMSQEPSELNSNKVTNLVSYWKGLKVSYKPRNQNQISNLYVSLEISKASKVKASIGWPCIITRHFSFLCIKIGRWEEKIDFR